MKKNFLGLILFLFAGFAFAQVNKVSVVKNDDGMKLTVNGDDFMINGMNWDYIPIGSNYSYDFWSKPDDFIKSALDAEMGLLKNMGVNAIRVYVGIQPKWVEYIYENYGIYTMLNHSFGRYGLTIDGVWTPVTDYRDAKTKALLMSEVTKMAQDYKNTPGLLLYLLGNENNYGLFWAGAETEDFPDEEDKKREVGEKRGRPMYKLMNDAILKMKEIDDSHPMAICNGDVLFIDIIADECKDVDIYATNMYRGVSFGDAFQVVKDKLNKPILFSEFGSDAFNAKDYKEDQKMQAYYMVNNWKEIYENAAGLDKVGNSIGGFTFQFSDGWWKAGQTKDLDTQQTESTWNAGGYTLDEAYKGANNMNEEWFGICAKGRSNARGLYTLYPRAAYYALKEAHNLNPYGEGIDSGFVSNYFSNISLMDAVLKARGDKATLQGGQNNKIGLSQLRAEFTTFNTGGNLIETPDTPNPDANNFPNQLGFDHMQSYFIGVEGNPAPNMKANVNFNILGNVADNPIDEIFYENRGREITVDSENGEVTISDPERIRIYQAEFEWNEKDFDLRGFYRTGHYHWGYEGDFFGLYPEANYGPNLDVYGGEILGLEIDGKRAIKGLKAAFGPQLWWGANPTALLKYHREIGKWDVTGIYHRDLQTEIEFDINGQRVLDANQVRSGIIPAWPTERASVVVERDFGKFGITLGGIWGGSPLNGSSFQVAKDNPNFTAGDPADEKYIIYEDKINSEDNWGAKAKVTYQGGKFNWYAQGSVMGLVANGGADQTQTFTGWRLRDSGSGNMTNVLSGFTYSFGNFQIAPNFMWQKPLVDPMPNDVSGTGRLRNVISDPFAVRGGNRETTAGELLITFDPTPGTWMYEWDNDRAEDAKFAFNLGFVYRHLPTAQDAHIGFQSDRTFFAFPTSAPAQNLWEVNSRIVSKATPDLGLIANLYLGNGQANGDSDRTIERFGGDVRMIHKKMKIMHSWKINDWGPFDYHRDFNLTYPVQLMLDISTSLGKPDWFILPNTRIGVRGTWRSLDPEFSNRHIARSAEEFSEPALSPVGFDNGDEWEIRTYIHINIGK